MAICPSRSLLARTTPCNQRTGNQPLAAVAVNERSPGDEIL